MVAYFSSKFKKQIQSAFSAALLVFCLLGTHWVGLSHGISHAGFQSQPLSTSSSGAIDKSLSHSSDVCHLFDALSLAGFIPNSQTNLKAVLLGAIAKSNANDSFLRNLVSAAYQSRAPPSFIL